MHFCSKVTVFINTVLAVGGWKYFTNLRDLSGRREYYNNPDPQVYYKLFHPKNVSVEGQDIEGKKTGNILHSDFIFGDCRNYENILYHAQHFAYINITGSLIVRGWLNIRNTPTCIAIRANAYEQDQEIFLRSQTYEMKICVPRMTFVHSCRRYHYFYYEWYLPDLVKEEVDWEMYFYGPYEEEGDWTMEDLKNYTHFHYGPLVYINKT